MKISVAVLLIFSQALSARFLIDFTRAPCQVVRFVCACSSSSANFSLPLLFESRKLMFFIADAPSKVKRYDYFNVRHVNRQHLYSENSLFFEEVFFFSKKRNRFYKMTFDEEKQSICVEGEHYKQRCYKELGRLEQEDYININCSCSNSKLLTESTVDIYPDDEDESGCYFWDDYPLGQNGSACGCLEVLGVNPIAINKLQVFDLTDKLYIKMIGSVEDVKSESLNECEVEFSDTEKKHILIIRLNDADVQEEDESEKEIIGILPDMSEWHRLVF